jgi:hypothetical protein
VRRNCNARAETVAGMPRKLATARGLEPWLLPQESGFNYKFALSLFRVAGGCSCRLDEREPLLELGKKRNKILVSPKSDNDSDCPPLKKLCLKTPQNGCNSQLFLTWIYL